MSSVLLPEITLSLRLGAARLAKGLEVRGGVVLALTVPADVTAASLSLTVSGLRLELPGSDLLNLLIPGGPVFEGDVAARAGATGVRFEGGGRDGIALRLGSTPAGLRAPSLYLTPRAGALRFVASFGASLLGLADVTVDGVGAEVALPPGGVVPVPPAGIGLVLSLGPAKGGGRLESSDGRYSGAVALRLGVVEVKAFAILQPQPMSLLAVLSAEFIPPIELGLAFTLNAVGGILGVNYAIDRAGLETAVQAGHLDDVLFPADPSAAAPQILSTLQSVFCMRPGSMVVGPMFRLGWGRPVSFVTADIGLVLELPSGVIGLLGRLRVALPAPQAPVIDLRAGVAGIVDAANGLVEIIADLAGSRLLFSPIAGGLALRVKSGSDATFILSAGGFHPSFPVPAAFPAPKRLSIAIADSPLLKIIFTGYFAVTPGTVQAGAALSASIGTPGTGVSGQLGFDALVRWEPSFGMVLDLYGSFHLRVGGASLCSVDLRVRVEGPTPCWHVAGRACVSLFFLDVSFPFDEHWGCTSQVTAPQPPDVLGKLREAVDDPRNWQPILPDNIGTLATLKADMDDPRLLHPLGRLRFSQRVVPLGVAITRFGPGRLPVATPFNVAVAFGAGAAGTAAPCKEQFARADFFDLTDEEKLTQPAFEVMRSGDELTPPSGPTAPGQPVQVLYETKWIGERGHGVPGIRWLLSDDSLVAALSHGAVARSSVHVDRARYAATGGAPRILKGRQYTIATTDTLAEKSPASRTATFTEAAVALADMKDRSRMYQVVPAHEVLR
ncbi:hypothetical protein OG894_42530 (plasmid) [Streptomyces sp. NBC_01724]|uniref:DUF6603 domain-containing protein n=1 Tax=Streptomyces sp. NBC_01724 TaxID=2975922 RepID=UPI002E3000C4|nr:DUF6603 domain-containing protein [Streptomyces sp. NBC_01724]